MGHRSARGRRVAQGRAGRADGSDRRRGVDHVRVHRPCDRDGHRGGASRHRRGRPGSRGLVASPSGHWLLPLVLIALSCTALLIFLMIGLVLPSVPGFVSNSHPRTYTPVTRLVDPSGELGMFVLLAAALGAEVLRAPMPIRRAGASKHGPG